MPSTWIETAEQELKLESSVYRKLPPEHLLTAIFVKYFLRDGELTSRDFRSCFTDGSGDGGIDAVAAYEQEESQRVALVQSKRVKKIDPDEILDVAHKVARTVEDIKQGLGAKYSLKLRRAYEYAKDSTDGAPVDIMICTTASPSAAARDKIHQSLSTDEYLKDFSVHVFYKEDLSDRIETFESPKEFVDEDFIERDMSSAILEYTAPGDDQPKGYLLSVRASSVNRLFLLYGEKGLFAQNLRTYIRNKKVDDGITNTIMNSPAEFWLKNNGITIACEDCRTDGSRMVLYTFSIINGCQTANRIGRSGVTADQDFLVPCKIIRERDAERMAGYAEAANAQKPIQDRDLKANAPEQKVLKQRFEMHRWPIYLGIKRGTRPFTKAQRVSRDLRDWQQLDNKLYGQLVLSFHRQKPYTAFSQAGSMFGSETVYREVFKRRQDFATEGDLLRLHDAFLAWREELGGGGASELEEAIVMQGRFALMSSCALLLKAKRGLVDVTKRNDKEEWKRELVRNGLKGRLFPRDTNVDLSDATVDRLNGLFRLLVEIHGSAMDAESVVNFYKSEDFHLATLTPRVLDRWEDTFLGRNLVEAMRAFD